MEFKCHTYKNYYIQIIWQKWCWCPRVAQIGWVGIFLGEKWHFKERSSFITHFVCQSVCPSVANCFFLHISYITRLDIFLEVPRQNIMCGNMIWKGWGDGRILGSNIRNVKSLLKKVIIFTLYYKWMIIWIGKKENYEK